MSSASAAGTVGVATLAMVGALAGCRQRPEMVGEPRSALETVDVGYGQQPRSSVVFAVSSLDRQQIAQMHVGSVADLLQRMPGVWVTQRMGYMSVRIRGAPGEPLFVLDGSPLMLGSGGGVVATLDPENVERIDVLRDGGASALYGARGGNGVILIRSRIIR